MAESRSWSLSPDASNGGRPSSVKALRTAEIALDHLGRGVGPALGLPLDDADAANPLLQFLLGVSVLFIDRAARFPQIMEMTSWYGTSGNTAATALRIDCWPSETTPKWPPDRRL